MEEIWFQLDYFNILIIICNCRLRGSILRTTALLSLSIQKGIFKTIWNFHKVFPITNFSPNSCSVNFITQPHFPGPDSTLSNKSCCPSHWELKVPTIGLVERRGAQEGGVGGTVTSKFSSIWLSLQTKCYGEARVDLTAIFNLHTFSRSCWFRAQRNDIHTFT